MAAPVTKDEELELDVESLAYGGNGVARLDGFVVFVRRGLPGDRVRARVTKVKRSHAEALATEIVRAGPAARRGAVRALPDVRRLPLPGSRVRGAARAEALAGARRARSGSPASPSRRSRRSSRASPTSSTTATRWSTRSRRRTTGPALGLHRAGRWDEVLDIEKCWLTTDLGNGIRDAVRDWAREEGLAAYSQEDGTGYLRHLVVREGRNTGQALVQLVTAPGEKFEHGYFVDVAARVPRGALDPLVGERHAGRGDEPADASCSGATAAIEEELGGLRFRVRPNAFLQTNTAMAEKLYGLAREAAQLTGERDRLGSLLRHRHDRPLAGGATRSRCGGSRSRRSRSRARSRTPS